jgi:hypothetical protein
MNKPLEIASTGESRDGRQSSRGKPTRSRANVRRPRRQPAQLRQRRPEGA